MRLEACAARGSYRPLDNRKSPSHWPAISHRILAEARIAETLPWDSAKLSLYRTIFPQMSLCLPEEERAQLRFQFEEELERLKAA